MGGIPKWARWDPSNLMGAKCPVRLCTGPRSLGKTYAMKKQGIKRYLEKGDTWAYTRYNDAMIERILRSPEGFLSDIERNNEFPGYTFRMNGRMMQCAYKPQKDTANIKWKPKWGSLGQMYALTSFDSYKGTTSAKCTLMVLDEFIKENKNVPYPPGCVDMLMNMWETFDRRENRVILVGLANNANLVNPIFRAWNITPIPKGSSRYFKVGNSHVYYENAFCAEFEKYSAQSNIGMFTAGSDYAEYAQQSEFMNATGLFVKKRPKGCDCIVAMLFKGIPFAVWQDIHTGDVFIDRKPPQNKAIAVLTRHDMTPDTRLIERTAPLIKFAMRSYSQGECYFDSDATREMWLDMLVMCGLK